MPNHLLKIVSEVGPLHIVWLIYCGLGSILFGIFSIPSHGFAQILILTFIVAGVVTIGGCAFCYKPRRLVLARKATFAGMALMTASAWLRGLALWSVDQQPGHFPLFGSLVWSWLSVGFAMMLTTIWVNGIRYS